MEYRLPGTRYKNLGRYDQVEQAPYNYERNGLLKKLLPSVIVNTKNATTKLVLDFVEQAAVFLLRYVDELKYFKDPFHKLY